MKNLCSKSVTIALLLAVATLSSCVKDSESDKISTTQSSLTFPWQAGEQSFVIKSDIEFTLTPTYEWIRLNQTEFSAGEFTVTVAVDENPSAETRIGEIDIFGKGVAKPVIVSIVQAASIKTPTLEVAHNDFNFDSRQRTLHIYVTSNSSFTVSCASDWIGCPSELFSKGSDVSIPITIDRNMVHDSRKGVIVVTNRENMTKEIEVVQGEFQPLVIPESDTVRIDGNHGSVSVNVSSDASFRLSTDVKWISFARTEFSADSLHTVSVDVTRNTTPVERTAQLIFTSNVSDEIGDTVLLIQGPKTAAIDNDILYIKFTRDRNPSLSRDYAFTPDENGVFAGRIPEPVDICNLVASYITTADKIYINSTLQVNHSSKQDFSKKLTVKAVAESGAVKNYTVDLVHFTGLPVLYINTASGTEIASKNAYESATWKMDGGRNFDNMALQTIAIHGRGNSSWSTFRKKPSYTVQLQEKQKVLGMPQHKKWVLIGNYRDKTLLRNNVAWWLSAKLSALQWTPRYQHVELVLNGTHRGVYQLVEQVRIDDDRVNVNKMAATDTQGSSITGGYIIELDRGSDADQWGWPMPYMKGSSHRANIKQPKVDEGNDTQKNYIYNYISNIDKLLGTSTDLTEVMTKYIDMPSWAAQWLVFEISGTTEPNGPNSWYTFKDKDNDKWYCGPCWDFDYRSYIPSTASGWINKNAIYMPYMCKYRPFKLELRAQWAILYPLYTELINYVQEQREYMRLSAEANWALHDQNLIDDGRHENGDEQMTSDDAIDRMLLYLKYKWTYINDHINEL